MALIRIDDIALAGNEALLRGQIRDLEALNARLEELLLRIESSWEGEASNAYIATMRARKLKAEQMVDVLNEFLSYIQETRGRFTSKDSDLAVLLRSAF